MSELLMLLKVISGARLIVSEGLSAVKAVKEYAEKSETLTSADKQTLLDELDNMNMEVQNSKFTDTDT